MGGGGQRGLKYKGMGGVSEAGASIHVSDWWAKVRKIANFSARFSSNITILDFARVVRRKF